MALSGQKRITLAITGASGAPYALCLLQQLVLQQVEIYLMISGAARVVLATENDLKLPSGNQAVAELLSARFGAAEGQIKVFGKEEWFSPVASWSVFC